VAIGGVAGAVYIGFIHFMFLLRGPFEFYELFSWITSGVKPGRV